MSVAKAHLVIIVHGVGKHDIEKRTRYLGGIKSNMAKLMKKLPDDQPIEFVFTEWHSTLSEFRDTVVQDLTLPKGFQLLKNIMCDVLSDALFYSELSHRERIMRRVVEQINSEADDFCKKYPNHNIQVIVKFQIFLLPLNFTYCVALFDIFSSKMFNSALRMSLNLLFC